MASCGVEIEPEILDMMSPEMQVIKASLKDKNMRLGIEQILRAMVTLMPKHEEELVSLRLYFFTSHVLLNCNRGDLHDILSPADFLLQSS